MIFMKRQNKYLLIFVTLLTISCAGEIPLRFLHSTKNGSSEIQKEERKNNERGCDLIWNIRYENQREIFFRNTCADRSCMVTWQAISFLGIWSSFHYDRIPPQSELSYLVPFYDVHFKVNYCFQ